MAYFAGIGPSAAPAAAKPSVPLTASVTVDHSIDTYCRFVSTFEAYEYSGWSDESYSGKSDCFIGDWSPLLKLRVRGPEALAFLQYISTNHWPSIQPGQAKHSINCQDNGTIIGEGLVMCLEKDDYLYTSVPGVTWAMFQFLHGRKRFNAQIENQTEDWYLLQVQGPNSVPLLDELTKASDGMGVRDIKFMHAKMLAIQGHEFRCLRQGISGELGFELWGKASEGPTVYQAIVEGGQKYNIRQLGARAKLVHHVEAAFPTPTVDFLPSIHTNDGEQIAYQAFLKDLNVAIDGPLSKVSGSYTNDPKKVHCSPFDLGWGWLVNFDHEFIGKEALIRIAKDPPNRLVTLVWNTEDVIDVYASLFRKEEGSYHLMELPRTLSGNVVASSVLNGEELIGYASSRCYSSWFKEMISLAVVKAQEATPGTEVTVVWGNLGQPQKNIRAIVQPAPYKKDNRKLSIRL